MSKAKVLIVSALHDVHARAVLKALADRRDVHAELLDLSEFPQQLMLTMEFSGSDRSFAISRKGRDPLDLQSIQSVWWRRPQPFGMSPAIRDTKHLRYAWSEATTAFQGLYQSMNASWVNKPVQDAAAAHKPWQLTIAQECGLDIPPTLMTTDPEAARAFWDRYPGEVVYKQFIALPDAWRETRRLTEDDAQAHEAIRLAPVIFQKYVPGACDLRVTIIGDEIFAACADLRSADYPLDVRFNRSVRYASTRLPPELQAKLHDLMRRLDLSYGAVDLRLTPDGQYVFLEINPAGQFLYIEEFTAQPISAALAASLAHAPRGKAN